ncbi:hypothetical protein D9M71_50340 [compost metagenome]
MPRSAWRASTAVNEALGSMAIFRSGRKSRNKVIWGVSQREAKAGPQRILNQRSLESWPSFKLASVSICKACDVAR